MIDLGKVLPAKIGCVWLVAQLTAVPISKGANFKDFDLLLVRMEDGRESVTA